MNKLFFEQTLKLTPEFNHSIAKKFFKLFPSDDEFFDWFFNTDMKMVSILDSINLYLYDLGLGNAFKLKDDEIKGFYIDSYYIIKMEMEDVSLVVYKYQDKYFKELIETRILNPSDVPKFIWERPL